MRIICLRNIPGLTGAATALTKTLTRYGNLRSSYQVSDMRYLMSLRAMACVDRSGYRNGISCEQFPLTIRCRMIGLLDRCSF